MKLESKDQHLNEAQFGSCFDDSDTAAADLAKKHVAECEQCRAELGRMRRAVQLFRDSNVAYAERELRQAQRAKTSAYHSRRSGLPAMPLWAAVALLAFVGSVPLATKKFAAPVPAASRIPAEVTAGNDSDQALLQEINREVSQSVPSSMQSLANPTGGDSSAPDAQTFNTRRN